MYKISIPIMNSNITRQGRERTLEELKRFDAERIFLALDCYETEPDARRKSMEELAENCRYFKAHGFEVGAWVWTFWIKGAHNYRNMRAISGTEITEFICPTDERFVDFACGYLQDIARCGVDIIQFDDDFRYGGLGDSPACLCDKHLEMIGKLVGEPVPREQMEKYITKGGRNKYRDAYIQANGDAFRSFAAAIRKAVDEIDPAIRISQCACLTSWDIDGILPQELSRILAGNTQPMVRLIGAPYWAARGSQGCALADVIEYERMESAWSREEDIELMAEGDAYPRPRSQCPASYLEIFDTAIRASGCTDGILKYGMDYVSNADYETGYAKMHQRNRALYPKLDAAFGGKTACGVRVYESLFKTRDMVHPTKVNDSMDLNRTLYSRAVRTMGHNTIPTVHEGNGVCGICFDENARTLPLEALEHGLILDIAAAEILTERGIDVGLCAIGAPIKADQERFCHNGNHILAYGATVYDITVNKKVEVLSEAAGTPVSYRYENAAGQRFLVLNTNSRPKENNLLKHYARSRQYADQIPWLGGNKLPAYVYGCPALYILCKKDEKTLAVGLWNCFADPAMEPVVELGATYSGISFHQGKGRLEGDKVYLDDIPPFGFAGFTVTL
ncbi:MAG: hypothetical protein IJ043_04980 [Clostridia bacterium]|nr:hypothetical protein [Clostridia bacterium]